MDKIVLVCLWSLMMVSLLEAELAVPFTKVVVLMMENQRYHAILTCERRDSSSFLSCTFADLFD